jgi:N-acetylmuramoyl-L-alanine amidase
MSMIQIPSPNYTRGRNGYQPEAIVIHIMEGTLTGTDAWFRNPQSRVSAHYGIGKNGDVHHYVQEADTAWHAGRVHAPAWSGIKPAGNGMYVNPNYYTIGIEHEGDAQSEWTNDMYNASAKLIAEMSKRWNIPIDQAHIIGHRQIYSLKACPGVKVNMETLIAISNKKPSSVLPPDFVAQTGTVTTITNLNLRKLSPSTKNPVAQTVVSGSVLHYTGYTDSGEKVKSTKRWYRTPEGLWFWAGGVK